MENNIKAKQVLLFILLIFSQNITWRLISLLPNIDEMMKKPMPFYQVLFSSVYIVFAIATTSDRESYIEFIKRYPRFQRCLNCFMQVLFRVVSGAISFLMAIPEFFCANKDDTRKIAIETKKNAEDIKNDFDSPIYEVRLVAAIGCIFLILVVISFFLNEISVSYIADICSMFSAIIGGIFVARNIKKYNSENTSV